MWCGQSWLVVAWLAAALSLAPRARAVPTALLSTLADTSICKTVVTHDTNEGRVPKIIKQVKCAGGAQGAQPAEAMCSALGGGAAEAPCCSQHSTPDVTFSCREVIDTVHVRQGGADGDLTPLLVSVGCACVMHRSSSALDA